ncbi:hypothetical protein [Parvularcula oceani]|uniref:hypothetical protein n=1 Tax=Parvularcula oceani TaxID=1247963 RepID=UPI0004E134F4|nr:hypothetical protein [Parvularcula oceani]
MMRIVTPILCLALAAAAAGRYHAEADVRAARSELSEVEAARLAEEEKAQRLRLEVEVLESAARLEELNAQTIKLAPARAEQLTTRSEFAERIGRPAGRDDSVDAASDIIGNAITMSDPAHAPGGRP